MIIHEEMAYTHTNISYVCVSVNQSHLYYLKVKILRDIYVSGSLF